MERERSVLTFHAFKSFSEDSGELGLQRRQLHARGEGPLHVPRLFMVPSLTTKMNEKEAQVIPTSVGTCGGPSQGPRPLAKERSTGESDRSRSRDCCEGEQKEVLKAAEAQTLDSIEKKLDLDSD